MATGDANVRILDLNASNIETVVEGLRVSANDKWAITSLQGRPGQVILLHIEEA